MANFLSNICFPGKLFLTCFNCFFSDFSLPLAIGNTLVLKVVHMYVLLSLRRKSVQEVSIVSKSWLCYILKTTKKISVCNSLVLSRKGVLELLNRSVQLLLFKPLLLFILQQGYLDCLLGDTGSGHCTSGVHCLSENREARQEQTS